MRFSEEERARLLEGWRRSGKSISAYVREKGLVRWTFTKWLKAERGGKPCFVEVPAEGILPAAQAPGIVIEKGDVKIHIPPGISTDRLRTIMEGTGVAQ